MKNMKKRTVVLFLLALVVLAIALWPSKTKGFVVKEVVDGNTLIMKNGVEVRMIGITSTVEGKEFLSKAKGRKVHLKADRTARFDPELVEKGDVVYAYVVVENTHMHLNASLLKEGYANLLEGAYLSDSLEAFRKYAKMGSSRDKEPPTPTPDPIIDYEDDDIILPTPPSPTRRLERKHHTWYADGNMNLEMLEEACDYDCPYTKQFANSLAAKSPGPFNPGDLHPDKDDRGQPAQPVPLFCRDSRPRDGDHLRDLLPALPIQGFCAQPEEGPSSLDP